jgi:hypothetical protein
VIAALVSVGFALGTLLLGRGWACACDPLTLLANRDAQPGDSDQLHRLLAETRGAHVNEHKVQLRFLQGNRRVWAAWLLQIGR